MTTAVRAPLLVATGVPAGGLCVVAGDEDQEQVVALAEGLVCRSAAAGALLDEPVVVFNPRRRPLSAALRSLEGVVEVRDGAGLRAACAAPPVREGRPPAHVVAFDAPHDLGHAGRRLLASAAAGAADAPWPLLLHVAADAPEVDVEHRRFRVSRSGVPMPAATDEVWFAGRRRHWTRHPGLAVVAPTTTQEHPWAVAQRVRQACGTEPDATPARAGATRSGDADLEDYDAALADLVAAAERHDRAIAAIAAGERRDLDGASGRRRRVLDWIAVEERAAALQVRRCGRLLGAAGASADGSASELPEPASVPPPDAEHRHEAAGPDGAMDALREAGRRLVEAVDQVERLTAP